MHNRLLRVRLALESLDQRLVPSGNPIIGDDTGTEGAGGSGSTTTGSGTGGSGGGNIVGSTSPPVAIWNDYTDVIGDGTLATNWLGNQEPTAQDILIFPAGTGGCDLSTFTAFAGIQVAQNYTGEILVNQISFGDQNVVFGGDFEGTELTFCGSTEMDNNPLLDAPTNIPLGAKVAVGSATLKSMTVDGNLVLGALGSTPRLTGVAGDFSNTIDVTGTGSITMVGKQMLEDLTIQIDNGAIWNMSNDITGVWNGSFSGYVSSANTNITANTIYVNCGAGVFNLDTCQVLANNISVEGVLSLSDTRINSNVDISSGTLKINGGGNNSVTILGTLTLSDAVITLDVNYYKSSTADTLNVTNLDIGSNCGVQATMLGTVPVGVTTDDCIISCANDITGEFAWFNNKTGNQSYIWNPAGDQYFLVYTPTA